MNSHRVTLISMQHKKVSMIEHPNVKERSLFEILRSTAKKKMMKRKNISRLAKFDKNMSRVIREKTEI